jgi:hypothetical protein
MPACWPPTPPPVLAWADGARGSSARRPVGPRAFRRGFGTTTASCGERHRPQAAQAARLGGEATTRRLSIVELISPALSHERVEIREAAAALGDRLPLAPAQRETAQPIRTTFEQSVRALPEPPHDATGLGATLPSAISDRKSWRQPLPDWSRMRVIQCCSRERSAVPCAPVARRTQLAEPLAKRASEHLPRWPSGLTSGDVCAIHLIARGTATELLSEPTYESGAIDLEVFIERAHKAYGQGSALGPRNTTSRWPYCGSTSAPVHHPDKLPRRVRSKLSDLRRQVPNSITRTPNT